MTSSTTVRQWPMPPEGTRQLTDTDELLFRQVNPIYVDQGTIGERAFLEISPVVGALAFHPGGKGTQCSCAQESLQTPEGAYKHHIGQGRTSAGTCAVSVGEIVRFGSRAIDDNDIQTTEPPTPGHGYIDFEGLTKSERSDLRDDLAAAATMRGFLFRP